MNRRRAHYVLSTHWDREWHQSFQDFRYRLVKLIDQIIDGLTDGRLKGPFQTDGQSIILEDYLEIRPERRARVEQLTRERKFVVGPWFTMPDEFTVSGESIVRNLRLGREIARTLGGEPSGAGFVCDIFGHNSQLPQIFAGFNIRGGLIWRGQNLVEQAHFLWRGADGTTLPCYRFGRTGYCTYTYDVRRSTDPNYQFDLAKARNDLEAFLENEAQRSAVDPVLVFDGGDHLEWDPQHYGVLIEYMQRDDAPFDIVHTCLDDYLTEMLAQADRIQTVLAGELREPALHPGDKDQQWLIPGVLSSRVVLKLVNRACETLLCHWAEPFSAFAHAALGVEYPQGFLNVAWRWLLKNHAHDSIDGCSIDQVHRDMRYRFDQCRLIAERLTTEATHSIAANVTGDVADDEMRVVVFNPLPQDFDGVTELTLQIPGEWRMFNEFFGFEPKPAFRIDDADGNELVYQRCAQAMNQIKKRLRGIKFPQAYRTHDVTVVVRLTVPAMGYTTLTVRQGEAGKPTRHPETPGLATSERSMENEFLKVEIESNGTLTLTDKRSGQTYERLLTFEDCADIGDGWYHGVAVNDEVFVSTASKSAVALVHNGPMLTTFRVRTTMSVPQEFRFDSMTRSEQFVELVIDSLISLRPGQDFVEVRTTVDNTADDHRLRVLFPSGAEAQTYLADSAFDVVERSIALRSDNHLYREVEVETKPQQSWTAVHDAQRGLAVVSDALLETAVRDVPARPIALTLFRGTRRTVMTNGEPEGQLRGQLTFDYRIVPLNGAPDRARLCALGQQLSARLRTAQLRAADQAIYRTERTLPPTDSFLRVSGAAVVTSVRQVGEHLEVRMFNPADQPTVVTLETRHMNSVQRVDLESNPVGECQWNDIDEPYEISLSPKQIVTLRVFKRGLIR
jgi:alpha-mannosidase/mannosylglycerate hydrolase